MQSYSTLHTETLRHRIQQRTQKKQSCVSTTGAADTRGGGWIGNMVTTGIMFPVDMVFKYGERCLIKSQTKYSMIIL